MQQHLLFPWRFLLFFTPLITSSAFFTSSSQAATLAFSDSNLEFTNFSQSPVRVQTSADTNAITIAKSGMVDAIANATANFLVAPPTASNSSLSIAFGEGQDYLGQAESQAIVIGDFLVDPDKTFSFDFTTDLSLQTALDNPTEEKARATGNTFFVLLDTNNKDKESIIDFFDLMGNIMTPSNGNFIAEQQSENITLSDKSIKSNFGGNQESATAQVSGSLKRYFTNQTNLSLVEIKRNRAIVVTPEPSSNIALLFWFSVVSVVLAGKRKVTASIRCK
ncbi:MAG: hypothetical protein H0X31_04280 [Nostocaceae cyanobacterium]|nr:hypothetical protein [Nostocaceae cyanobacterium]